MSTKTKVLILGVGPSGILAGHAAKMLGASVTYFSKQVQLSVLNGCQYLHARIPEVETTSTLVTTELRGDIEGYRKKVYGDGWYGPVSPEKFAGKTEIAWDLRYAYRDLYDRYIGDDWVIGGRRSSRAFHFKVSPEDVASQLWKLREDFDIIISTVPARDLCFRPGEHEFRTQDVYATGDRIGEEGLSLGYSPLRSSEKDLVVCDGTSDTSWYRASRVFGASTTEWSAVGKPKPPIEGVVLVKKPLVTNCNCFPAIERLGRYGSWRKSVLTHDVFQQAWNLISNKTGSISGETYPREDECQKCLRPAHSERYLLEFDATEYICLSGHRWNNREPN